MWRDLGICLGLRVKGADICDASYTVPGDTALSFYHHPKPKMEMLEEWLFDCPVLNRINFVPRCFKLRHWWYNFFCGVSSFSPLYMSILLCSTVLLSFLRYSLPGKPTCWLIGSSTLTSYWLHHLRPCCHRLRLILLMEPAGLQFLYHLSRTILSLYDLLRKRPNLFLHGDQSGNSIQI